jgi:hypothetical protein
VRGVGAAMSIDAVVEPCLESGRHKSRVSTRARFLVGGSPRWDMATTAVLIAAVESKARVADPGKCHC